MLIVDSQIHIWENETMPGQHRRYAGALHRTAAITGVQHTLPWNRLTQTFFADCAFPG